MQVFTALCATLHQRPPLSVSLLLPMATGRGELGRAPDASQSEFAAAAARAAATAAASLQRVAAALPLEAETFAAVVRNSPTLSESLLPTILFYCVAPSTDARARPFNVSFCPAHFVCILVRYTHRSMRAASRSTRSPRMRQLCRSHRWHLVPATVGWGGVLLLWRF